MLNLADTIVAVATPPGEGGVAIVRLSGARALEIGRALVHPSPRRATWTSSHLLHGHVVDAESGRRIDEVLAVYMAAPRTYTAEDVFEIHCHGGPMPVRAVVELALRHGARAADRGEFTLRAFLNGRLDLSQAEAVLDVVRARTPTALQVAVGQLAGTLTRRLYPVVDDLMGVLAYLEASIDFVEEGIPSTATDALLTRLIGARDRLRDLLATAHDGIILREGVRAVLAGAPNVGKSSLLNRLLRVERAIVTPIAGTTRDTVEEPANIRDLPVYLVDTAGLTETDDPVERIGVQRSRAAIASAGLLLLVADASRTFEPRDREAFAAARAIAPETPAVLVLNKCDLPPRLEAADAWPFPELARPATTVAVSAATGEGLEGLEEAIAAAVLTNGGAAPDAAMVTNARHRRSLEEALAALEATIGGMEGDRALELICSDLRAATRALGTITGQDIGEDLLSRIFSEFCIGK
jgi:tRNA modification GTPase